VIIYRRRVLAARGSVSVIAEQFFTDFTKSSLFIRLFIYTTRQTDKHLDGNATIKKNI